MVFRASNAFLASITSALVGVGALCLLSVRPADAQTAIQITAPASGTRVAPGATVTVSVSLGPGVTVSEALILGENPIGLSNPLTAAPFQFPITIPTNINAGLYHLTADAIGSQGQDLQSASIVIDVEPSGSITSMLIQPGIILFKFSGDSLPVRVLGTLLAGGQVDLTESTLITYTSSNTKVATVSGTGVVTAIGPGTASITVSGPAPPYAIPVFVPIPTLTSGSNCNGTYTGTFKGNLTVTNGQTCVLTGGGVTGNVEVTGGSLVLSNTFVGKNLRINGGGTFAIGPFATIEGSLQIKDIPAGSVQNQICGSSVKGDLGFRDNGTAVQIGSVNALSCAGNTIDGNLEVGNNSAATVIAGNIVERSLLDDNNTASTQVFNNTVKRDLRCENNSSITGGGNIAPEKLGQCASF
jgi:hypothetical protein